MGSAQAAGVVRCSPDSLRGSLCHRCSVSKTRGAAVKPTDNPDGSGVAVPGDEADDVCPITQ
jgi:hypothetical protein